MLGIYAIVAAPWTGVFAGLLLVAFVLRQRWAATPLLKLRVFASRNVAGVYFAQLLVIAAAWGFQVLITMYMQHVLGYGAAATGLAFAPTAVVIGAVSLGVAARLIARLGARNVLLAGLVLVVVALSMLTALPTHGDYVFWLLPALLVFGAGGGLTLPALATLGMAEATPQDAGLISGLFNTGQQVGGAIGVAALSSLAAAHARALGLSGRDAASALTGGYHLAFGIGAALGAGAIALTATVLRRR
jgi:predicted MFS family arabinose efflux permease